ncbi:MAG: MGH1-like glycoside hydrolase domain-containing protein, partial [Phycisphaerae bacterium]
MHPNGQIPAYEWNMSDVNPPVHAWACWRVYKKSGPPGGRDREFLERTFQKLLMNFTWWVNRKDLLGKHIFSGGFLGLDNIGVFDRSKPLPTGGHLHQADGTAWMAFFCARMLRMSLELASNNSAYADMASKFFEHYIEIADAMNSLGETGLWDEQDGFYYDHLFNEEQHIPL